MIQDAPLMELITDIQTIIDPALEATPEMGKSSYFSR